MGVTLFVLLAIFGVLPMVHGTSLLGLELALKPVAGILKFYFLLMAGLLCYLFKIPERWIPGFFDIWGHSHQIWHLFVFFGTLQHYRTCEEIVEMALAMDCGKFG